MRQAGFEVSTHFRLSQRFALWLAPPLAALLIAAVGKTLRFADVVEEGAIVQTPPIHGIFCFWHQCTFAAAWRFRHFHPHILISRSFDGELVARTLALLGYSTVRGSSSRGAVAGLLGLRKVVDGGTAVIFTADGPRGPLYQAKPGPIKLAQMTGCAIGTFHLQPERAWMLSSWDRFMIPKPFTRVVVAWSRPVPAPQPGAGEEELEQARKQLNAALDRARTVATETAMSRTRTALS